MVSVALWSATQGGAPRRLTASPPETEAALEKWVRADPALVRDGLVVVAQQLTFPRRERLDLLCIENRSRWLIVELKRNRLSREVASQVLDYASLLVQMSASELRSRLEPHLAQAPQDTQALVADLLSAESAENPREVAAVVVGIVADESLRRITRYLSEAPYQVPISVVELQAFETPSGDLLIAREETGTEAETEVASEGSRPSASIDERWSRVAGVAGPSFAQALHDFQDSLLQSPIYLRPYTRSIMLAPASNRTRYLAVVSFDPAGNGQDLAYMSYGVDAIREFFPQLQPAQIARTLGPDSAVLTPQQLVAFGENFASIVADAAS